MGENREIIEMSKQQEENTGENKLIFFLSKYKFKPQNCHYKSKYDDGNNDIYGKQTPDAPTKYFINYLTENGEKLDSILCITSKDTNERKKNKNKPDDQYESAFENYQKVVNDFCDEKKLEVPKLIKLNFDYNFEKGELIDENDIYRNLFKSIVDEISEEDTIYIDYTSGIRDTSLLIILMIRYLEYTGIKCGGMIYSYFDIEDTTKNKIIDIKSTYDLFELLNGVNEFTSFGKSKTLSNYYNNIWKDKEEYKEINELIKTMDNFSDMMSLCMVEDIDEIMKDLNKKIIEAEKIKDKINNKENRLMNYMFFNLIKEIKKKFYLEDDKEITYINLIRWCLDNDLIQQALTLYVEKMPEYYATHDFYDINERSLKKTLQISNTKSDEYAQIFYTRLFKNIEFYKGYYGFKVNNNGQIESKVFDYNFDKINEIKDVIIENKEKILKREDSFLKNFDEHIKSVIEKMYIIMDKTYRGESKGIKIRDIEISNQTPGIPKSEEKFLNWINVQNKLIHYLLEENRDSNILTFLPVAAEGDNFLDFIYNEKINVIIILRKSYKNPPWSNINIEDIITLMEEYLFFKIMRNQINHAKKSDLKIEVKDYFERFGYNTEISVENIKEKMINSIKKVGNIRLASKINKNEMMKEPVLTI